MRINWRKKRVPCPDCKAKGRPSTWFVPAHVNDWRWGIVPGYTNRCFTCDGKGRVRAD